MANKKILDKVLKQYGLNIKEVEDRSLELCEVEDEFNEYINLVYFALDIVADNFKMAVITRIEDKNLQEKTGISCISDIEVHINVQEGKFDGLLGEFDLADLSKKNVKAFIKAFKNAPEARDIDTEVKVWFQGVKSFVGMDRPENEDDIITFIINDVQETADSKEYHSGDFAIAFRRFIEIN